MALPTNKPPSAPDEKKPDVTVVSEGPSDGPGGEDQYATLASSSKAHASTEKAPADASFGTLALSGETPPVASPPDCTLPLPGSAPPKADSDTTYVMSDEDEGVHAAPDTCQLPPAGAVPPTEHLARRKQTMAPLDQTLNLPDASRSPGQTEPPGTEVIDPPSRDGTQVLSEYDQRQEEDPLYQTLQEPALSSGKTAEMDEVPLTQHGHAAEHPPELTMMPATAPSPPTDARGRRIVVPGYELLGELGRGGMGIVYKARHLRLNRLVALKMIRSGAQAGSEDLLRFRTEAEAVAKLQHVNIVQIYEIGEVDGLPWFSLEFIDGGSLHDRLKKETGLAARQAAELVESLARAMHYAHERGVIHRDLKPANVLLQQHTTTENTDATDRKRKLASSSVVSVSSVVGFVPKITDFGLAKHLEKDHGHTREGSILGTPSYMAPEQAEGRNKDIGPPADIYALGAILYDLLASRPPFRGETVMDTLHQVINTDPVPPTRLQPKLSRDLETICLKCLQKDSAKRYNTAGELADDLRRFLDGKPILARATPAWEKALKWARRRPAAATLIAFAFLTVVGAVVGSSIYAGIERRRADTEAELRAEAEAEHRRADENAAREKKQRERADQNAARETEQRQRADATAREERRQRLRADRRTRDALEAVDLLTRGAEERLEHVPSLQDLRRDFLLGARNFYERFLRDNSDDPALRDQSGFAYRRVGAIFDKLGERDKAEQSYRKALAFFDGLRKDAPTDPYHRRQVALASDDLAIALHANQKHAEAAKYFDDAIRLLRELQPRHANPLALLVGAVAGPAQPPGQRWNAVWQMVVAETATEEARRERALLADAHLHRGNLRLGLRQDAGAAEDLQNALPLYERLHAESPRTTAYQVRLAEANNSLGVILFKNDPKRSLQALGRAIALLEPLTNRLGHIAEYRATLAHACRTRAVLRLVLLQREQQEKAKPSPNCARPEDSPREEPAPEVNKANEQAESDLRRSADLLAKLAAEYRFPEYRMQLIEAREMLAFHTHTALRDPREAVRVWQDVLPDLRQLPPKFRTDPHWRVKLAIAYDGLAQSFSAAQVRRIQDASDAWKKALDVAELLVEENENNPAFWKLWVDAYFNRIAMWQAQLRTADAESDYRALVPLLDRRVRKFSEVSHLIELAHAHHEWALLLRQRNQAKEAERQLKLAVARQREVVAKVPAEACQYWSLCVYQLAAGEDEAAAETVGAWVKAVPEDRQPRYHEAAWCLAQCAARAAKQGKAAEPLARRAVELLRKASGKGFADARFLAKKEFDVLREREDFKQVESSLAKPK